MIVRTYLAAGLLSRYNRTIMRPEESKRGVQAPPSLLVQEDAVALGLRVREARCGQGLDQKEVAFAANVSPRTVFAIEKGKPTVRADMLIRVMAAVGLRLTTERRDRTWAPSSSSR
jgi:DNA-binding XRE family transcriptional regulator